jgi:hypothetical protein
MMKAVILVLAGSFVFMTGCTANGPAFSPVENPDANKAVVYIYRPFNIVGAGETPDVYIDEVKYGPLKNNGYLVYFVEPGKRMIANKDPHVPEPMAIYPDLEAGKEYYIRRAYVSNIGSIGIQIAVIPKEYAIQEIKLTKKAD